MKKYLAAIIAVLVCLAFSACSADKKDAAASDIVYSAIADCTSMKGSYTTYFANGSEGGDGYLSQEELYALYYRDVPPADELTLLCDWCIAISSSPEVRELHVMKVKSKSDRERIADMLKRRAKLLSAPELFRAKSELLGTRPLQTGVFFCGNFVILAAGNDVREVVNYLD